MASCLHVLFMLFQEPSNTVAISWMKKHNQLKSWKLRALSLHCIRVKIRLLVCIVLRQRSTQDVELSVLRQ